MPKKEPLVTIILPVYNGEKTLKKTLQSLIAQTYTNFELLIGIDGTSDGSIAIVESFQDNRIQVIENTKNLGLGPNLNKLISIASSESVFIAMAEQDDVYVAERIMWQVEVLEKHPKVGLVSGIAEFVSENNRILFPGILIKGNQFPQGQALFKYLYINQLKVVNTCMLFRKIVHQEHNLSFTNDYGNHNADWDYVLRFSLVSKVYGIPKKLVSMNRNSSLKSVTTNKEQQFKMSLKLLNNFKQEFPELIDRTTYCKAIKTHRKIKLGHRTKAGIIGYSLYYFFRYIDIYFLKYIAHRLRKYIFK